LISNHLEKCVRAESAVPDIPGLDIASPYHGGQHPEFSAEHILRVVAMPTSRTILGLLDELAARFPERDALVGSAP
jgi:hypothetical protein